MSIYYHYYFSTEYCLCVCLQLLDDITGATQLSLGNTIVVLGLILCYLLCKKKRPQLLCRENLVYFLVLLASYPLSQLFTLLATVHIAVGTMSAVLMVSTLFLTLTASTLKDLYLRVETNLVLLSLDCVVVLVLSAGIVFIAQPRDIFGGLKYFEKSTVSYTSLCNEQRFVNLSSGNWSENSITEDYLAHSWKGYLYAISAGLCWACLLLSTKQMYKRDSMEDILFWMYLVSSCVFLLATLCSAKGFVLPAGSTCRSLLLANALCGGLADFLYLQAVRLISSVDVATIQGFQMPLLFLFQFTFLRKISPTPTNAVAIVAAVTVLIIIFAKPFLQAFLSKNGYIK